MRYYDVEAWREAWGDPAQFGQRRASQDLLQRAAYFIAGAIRSSGFRYFANGGLPLFERRWDGRVEEILLRAGGYDSRSKSRRLRLEIHLSDERIRAVRESYWWAIGRVPTGVASGDVGELDLPPCRMIWEFSGEPEPLNQMATVLETQVIPWFNVFDRPDRAEAALLGPGIPLITDQTAVEWLLAYGGRRTAAEYLEGHLSTEFWDELRQVGHFKGANFDRATPERRLAVLAHRYRLV